MIEKLAESMWEGRTFAARASRVALTPLSALFSVASRTRSFLYDTGRLPARRAPVPVISVGNLRVGGSSKTPTVLWLVDRLRRLGVRPVVAMRGYGAGPGAAPTWLESNEDESSTDSPQRHVLSQIGFRVVSQRDVDHDSGISDEALLVALRSGVAVASAPDRAMAAFAASAVGADVLVLDDGFQHRRLQRDLDIVLTRRSESGERMLPAGPLREPWPALRRADVVLAPEALTVPGDALVVSARPCPVGWVDRVAATAPLTPLESWRGREAVAVAGIARPERFFEMLEQCGVRIRAHRVFRDHHRYTRQDWADLRGCLSAQEWLVTTEKDLVKLRGMEEGDVRLAALRIEMRVEPEDEILRRVRAILPRLDASRGGPHDR